MYVDKSEQLNNCRIIIEQKRQSSVEALIVNFVCWNESYDGAFQTGKANGTVDARRDAYRRN